MDDDQTQENLDQIDPNNAKQQPVKSPMETGEENISGNIPAESPDIDEELEKVGLVGDNQGPKPLGED